MPILFEKSFEKLQGESMAELTSSTPITRITPGSKAKAVLQTLNKKLNKSYQEMDLNFVQAFLPFAQGKFLDYTGEMLGLPRLGAQRATASADSKAVRFYVDTGTFGDINGSSNISIPAGTRLSTQRGGVGIVYRVAVTTVLLAGLSEQYVAVESLKDGDTQNLGINTLRFHSFTGLSGDPTLLKVNNPGSIFNGASLETDTNYRFRIAAQALTGERANETAIRLALLVVPGIADLVAIPYARGIGTYDVIIQSVVPNTPANIVEAARAAVSRVVAQGVEVQVERPRLTGMSFQVSVTWRDGTPEADRRSIKTRIIDALSRYVNNLVIGEEFIVNEAIERIMAVDNRIKNIGSAQKPLDAMFIHRESKLRDNKIKEELLGDFDSDDDERLIIEPSLEIPIVVLDKN